MEKPKQPVEKPELKHEYDFDEGGPLSQDYFDAVMPDHVKEAIAKRKGTNSESRPAADDKEPEEKQPN